MAQTTGANSARNVFCEFSTNGSSWTDCSGFTNKVAWDGGERATGNAHTYDVDTPVHTRGKLDPHTVTFSGLFTEGAAELSRVAHSAWKNGTDFYLRWTPLGNTTGNIRYTTTAGTVKSPVHPSELDGESGEAMAVEIVLECANIADAAIP